MNSTLLFVEARGINLKHHHNGTDINENRCGRQLRQTMSQPVRKRERNLIKSCADRKEQICVRCNKKFRASENHSKACLYHGDILGNTMPLNLYEDHHFDDAALDNRPGPRYGQRWACCQDTDPEAPPCKYGFHVTWNCSKDRWAQDVSFAVK